MDLQLDEHPAETPKVNSAFSINAIHRVFSEISGEGLELLESIGFHGLTKIRKISKLNRQLALWLLRNMDPDNCSILFGDGSRKPISESDVQLIIGVHDGGPEITFPPCSKKILDKAAYMLFLHPGEAVTLDHLEDLLTASYGYKMVEQERVAFTIAAVLYAEAHFLAPKGNHPKVNKQLLQLLCTRPFVETWNWARYVLNALKVSSMRVQEALDKSNKTITLDGCLLLIQIFYLDNLDFGSMVLPYIAMPRLIDFTSQRLKVYADADWKGNDDGNFGSRKLKKRNNVLYEWGRKSWSGLPVKHHNIHSFFNGTVVEFISTLLDDNKGCSGHSMEILSQYIAHYIQCTGYHPSTPSGSAVSNPDNSQHFENIDAGRNDPDLLGPHLIINYEFKVIAKEVIIHSDFLPAPFGLLDEPPQPHITQVRAMAHQVAAMDDDDKGNVWFLHEIPYMLSISGNSIHKQFALGDDLHWTFIDAAIRMFTLLDDKMYSPFFLDRWRHFVPSYWAIDVLRAGELTQSEMVRDMFIGGHLNYNVENCNMIIAPVMVGWSWHCYAWDFKQKIITVLDPTRMGCAEDEIEHAHSRTVHRLHNGLFDCKNTFFKGWNVSRKQWSCRYLSIAGAGGPRELSGLYALHYALYFGGEGLTRTLGMEGASTFRDQLLYKVLKMQGNMGIIPKIRKLRTSSS